jgi:putative hydrolase of HD superfamily
MNFNGIANYIFELNALKKFEHSGFKLAGIKNPDTIAEHVQRTCIIGYILAKLENADTEKVLLSCLIHDNGEARITDLHKVAARYIDSKGPEARAFAEQSDSLPKEIAQIFKICFEEYSERKTPEGIISRDADLLEVAFQAKEYLDLGHKACQNWIDNVGKALKTASARKIFREMAKTDFTDWWHNLKKIS